MTELILKALLAYLLGNLMGGHIVGRLRGIDLARSGSGNVGATNALRAGGTRFGLMVLAVDVAKGVAGALLVPLLPLYPGDAPASAECLGYACGAAVTLGHCYPALWRFKGGKGVATLAGVYGALMPAALLWILLGFALVVVLSGYVSLATLVATLVAVGCVAVTDPQNLWSPAGAFTLSMAALLWFKHRHNVARLLTGSEHRFDKLRLVGRWRNR